MGKDALSLARASHGLQLQLLHNVAAVEAHTHVCADMCVCVHQNVRECCFCSSMTVCRNVCAWRCLCVCVSVSVHVCVC